MSETHDETVNRLRDAVIEAIATHAAVHRDEYTGHHAVLDCPMIMPALDRLIAYEKALAVFDHYNGPSRRAVGSTAWIAARAELDRLTESAKEPTP